MGCCCSRDADSDAGAERLVSRRRNAPKYSHVRNGESPTCCSTPDALMPGELVMLVRLKGSARKHNGKVGTVAKVSGRGENQKVTVALRSESRAGTQSALRRARHSFPDVLLSLFRGSRYHIKSRA